MTARRCTVDGCGRVMRPHLRHAHELEPGTPVRCGPHDGTISENNLDRPTATVVANFPDRDSRNRRRHLAPATEVEPLVGDDAPVRTWVFDDGGRAEAGYTGTARDCFVRAVAIATGLGYQTVYDMVNEHAKRERLGKRKRSKSSAREGVYSATARRIMEDLGWPWTATMQIGSGCTTHLTPDELPGGRIICRVSKHYVAVVDGVVHDTKDPTRGGTRCVYGYWSEPS